MIFVEALRGRVAIEIDDADEIAGDND